MTLDIRILVVEDSAGTRVLVKKILQNLGYKKVELASDGLDALEFMGKKDFDLIISDWIMPNMDGIELVQAIRKQPKWKDLPVLLVTADEEPENIMLAMRAGASNYMTKPYNAKELREKIRRIFEFSAKLAERGV